MHFEPPFFPSLTSRHFGVSNDGNGRPEVVARAQQSGPLVVFCFLDKAPDSLSLFSPFPQFKFVIPSSPSFFRNPADNSSWRESSALIENSPPYFFLFYVLFFFFSFLAPLALKSLLLVLSFPVLPPNFHLLAAYELFS